MRITCPSCQAAYDVPAAVIQSGRKLRCVRCVTEFTPKDELEAAPVAVAPAADLALQAAAALPQAGSDGAALPDNSLDAPHAADASQPLPPLSQALGRGPQIPVTLLPRAVLTAWVASFVLLAAMGWSFIAWRVPIMQAWPASSRLYAVLGLKV